MKTRSLSDSVLGLASLALIATLSLSGCKPQSSGLGPAFIVDADLQASHLDYTCFNRGWYEYADIMEGDGYIRARTTPDPPYEGVPTKFELRLATTPQLQVTHVLVRTVPAESEYLSSRPSPETRWQETRLIQPSATTPDTAEDEIPPSGNLREFLYLHSVTETTYQITLDIPEGQQNIEFKIEMADGTSMTYPGWPLVSHRRVATAVVPF